MNRLLLLTDNRVVGLYEQELSQAGYSVQTEENLPVDFDTSNLILISANGTPSRCLDYIREVRAGSAIPVLVLSGSEDVTHCVIALEVGADDYVREPVAQLELLARIRALLRRSLPATAPRNAMSIDDIELQVGSRTVKQAGKLVELTAIEFDFLKLLMASAGNVLTREVIAKEVFRRRPASCDRSIDVHMSGLRKKLGLRGDSTDRIRTIRGFGYIYLVGDR